MKRFHIHVGVTNLEESVQFYSTLFGTSPSKLKEDYAKWMLEDPKLNFAISTRAGKGVDHLGIQVEEDSDLSEIAERLKKANLGVYGEGEVTCCYALSNKAWVQDPSGIAWEAYRNMSDVDLFNGELKSKDEVACCAPPSESKKSRCC